MFATHAGSRCLGRSRAARLNAASVHRVHPPCSVHCSVSKFLYLKHLPYRESPPGDLDILGVWIESGKGQGESGHEMDCAARPTSLFPWTNSTRVLGGLESARALVDPFFFFLNLQRVKTQDWQLVTRELTHLAHQRKHGKKYGTRGPFRISYPCVRTTDDLKARKVHPIYSVHHTPLPPPTSHQLATQNAQPSYSGPHARSLNSLTAKHILIPPPPSPSPSPGLKVVRYSFYRIRPASEKKKLNAKPLAIHLADEGCWPGRPPVNQCGRVNCQATSSRSPLCSKAALSGQTPRCTRPRSHSGLGR